MPTLPAARRRWPRRALPFLVLIALSQAGCAGGDFGRVRRSAVSDDMHSWIGAEATSSIGLRPSEFNLTDGEKMMRDLAFPLIEPPHSRPAWKSVFGDYKPLPSPWRQAPAFDRTTYGRMLIDEPHRSHTSRYNELMDDVRSDILRFETFYGSASRVIELDRKRNASLKLVSSLSPQEREDALARMDENALILQWVEQCLQRRVSSYRWALERLVVHTPDQLAASADMLIGEMAAQTTVIASSAARPSRSGTVLK
ncbi:hypothetical protein [Tardiphaga sp.]|uniref:hypothetical protein n=1 Tax=Tardiphaga sp. TaxID=1926292 RepID=UPI0026143EAD|nr:hypothetical protein [Tardiphaga sp.]MDB5619953.1 hypothetical protein [Tardiphaga sp.]